MIIWRPLLLSSKHMVHRLNRQCELNCKVVKLKTSSAKAQTDSTVCVRNPALLDTKLGRRLAAAGRSHGVRSGVSARHLAPSQSQDKQVSARAAAASSQINNPANKNKEKFTMQFASTLHSNGFRTRKINLID